ncbi:MAG: hypothetical protein JWR11_1381 [Mycobacterium sp.]|nr:hypothetical protein [Mycobacterium sp.]
MPNKHVGRVGALAVALGIGAAIASAPTAFADEGAGSGSSSGSSDSSASSGANDASSTKKPETSSEKKEPDKKESDGRKSHQESATPTHESQARSAGNGSKKAKKSTTEPETVSGGETDSGPDKPTEPKPAAGESTVPGGSPATPPQAAPTWTMLGLARRETVRVATTPAKAAEATTTAVVQPTVSVTVTSPLGTQQQLDAERIATQTVDTLPVALMKLVLQLGFRSAAQQQFGQVGGPDQANLDQLSAAVDEYAMGAAFQQQILDSNDPTVVMQVAPPHTWYGQIVPGSRILYDNPDTIYRFMGVNAASSYVISGQFTGPRPADTTFSVLTGLSGNTASVLGGQDFVVNPNGTFTITVSRDPAAPGQTNHLQLTNDSTLIATRNTLSDWGAEVPMTLSIERVGGPPNSLFGQLGGFAIPGLGPLVVGNPWLTTLVSLIPPMADPPPLLRGTVAAVIMALGIQREATYMGVATTDPTTGQQIPPNVLKSPTRNAEFLATQLQSAGYFQLGDDQALVVTIDPGNAGYFVLPVTNDWTISTDYWNQQTSLNGSQAIANADGTYTLVISKTDPGVANWVSTGGLNQGTISMRFQDLDPDSTDLPTVSSQLVSLVQLPSVVPPNTVYYTEAQRRAQLAIRKVGFDNRFAPYPQP